MRILLVADHFYPQKNAGIDRPLSLYNFADENGIELHVATATHVHEPPVSMKNVFRIESIEGWNTPSQFLKKFPYKLKTKIAEPFYFNIDYYWMKMMYAYFTPRALAPYDAIYFI
jgi:hypothetical protein